MAIASTILMIRPAAFGYNAETAINNHFQSIPSIDPASLQRKAVEEFDAMVDVLSGHAIDVWVIDDTPDPAKPDAIFPNNWISTFPNGTVSVFPLFAESRRAERREDIIHDLSSRYVVRSLQDWSEYEVEHRFLEGTGSMVIDHDHKMIYSTISERTSLAVLEKFASANQYQAIVFIATDRQGYPIYHTNVVLTIGDEFAILCEEAIDEEWELIAVRQLLESTGHSIIPISRDQLHCFAGNMLQVKNGRNEKYLLMSETARRSLKKEQLRMLEAFGHLLPIAIPTIEEVEGGSVRCMIAEIFLKKR